MLSTLIKTCGLIFRDIFNYNKIYSVWFWQRSSYRKINFLMTFLNLVQCYYSYYNQFWQLILVPKCCHTSTRPVERDGNVIKAGYIPFTDRFRWDSERWLSGGFFARLYEPTSRRRVSLIYCAITFNVLYFAVIFMITVPL